LHGKDGRAQDLPHQDRVETSKPVRDFFNWQGDLQQRRWQANLVGCRVEEEYYYDPEEVCGNR
jgi:hypothetical protein